MFHYIVHPIKWTAFTERNKADRGWKQETTHKKGKHTCICVKYSGIQQLSSYVETQLRDIVNQLRVAGKIAKTCYCWVYSWDLIYIFVLIREQKLNVQKRFTHLYFLFISLG